MRAAIFADVHGNSLALAQCMQTVSAMDVEATYFLGDLVGYLPGEEQCLDLLEVLEPACQRGNHEEMLLTPTPRSEAHDDVYGLRAARSRLGSKALERLASWPARREPRIGGRHLLLVHGSPSDPLGGYVYPDSDLSGFGALPYDAVLMAHTHRPFVARVADTVVANVGSVGLPRDVGALSCFAIYDSEANDVSIFRLRMDVPAVLARWGDRMHHSTRKCLLRASPQFVGEVIG